MSIATLLPPNRRPLDAMIEQALANTLDPSAISALWNPHDCPANMLPWLAWAFSVDEWDDAWPESVQRAVVAESIAVHRIKGTIAAIRRVFHALGYGDIIIQEGRGGHVRDGSITRDDFYLRGTGETDWAVYRIVMAELLPVRAATIARAMLAQNAPARCHLYEINFTGANLVRAPYNYRDGTWSRGTA